MSHHRHSDENRTRIVSTPAGTKRLIRWYRREADLRKLTLLECGIIRHAPFADCGRPLWDLMADQPWFEQTMLPAGWYRAWFSLAGEVMGRISDTNADELPGGPEGGWSASSFRMNGHQAVEWLESYPIDQDSDRRLLAQQFFVDAERSSETDLFDTPGDRRDELEIRYGVAYWLLELAWRPPSPNILDFYLANYPGAFNRCDGWRPLHPGHRAVAVGLIEDILWHPSRSKRFHASWRSTDAFAVASAMEESRDFAPMPVLADALEEAGCDNQDILAHCRGEGIHSRGCWVVDRVLKRS